MRLIPDDQWGIITVFAEARGEEYRGKLAVAEVIVRRTARKFFSDGTVVGTVLRPMQFSCWNTRDPNRLSAALADDTDSVVRACIEAWHDAQLGSNVTNGALYYHNPKLSGPPWGELGRLTVSIGKHDFGV